MGDLTHLRPPEPCADLQSRLAHVMRREAGLWRILAVAADLPEVRDERRKFADWLNDTATWAERQ